MYDPFHREYGSSLLHSAGDVFLIARSDADNLEKGVKALRIWNPSDTSKTIAIKLISGRSVTLTIPPLSLVVELVRAMQVLATGTASELIIHGYSDSEYAA